MKAHLICHTHWDREWYFTREVFRTRLVRLLDSVLALLDKEPSFQFMLDGQTIVLTDYLDIKPEQQARLQRALSSGRLVCGPWYILPDELLVSGEAHIRNGIIGASVMDGFCTPMRIGYLPDSFGHPAQMPQILTGLGMDTAVFWRGVPFSVPQSEFLWASPHDAAQVLAIHMPFGYGNSARLSCDMQRTEPRVRQMIAALATLSSTDAVLLMNGSDHIVQQMDIVQVVDDLNTHLPQDTICISSLAAYLSDIKPKLPALYTHTGELRSSERAFVLGGTLSTRMELKQWNEATQTLMERYWEPMLSYERLLGHTFDSRGYTRYVWKKILENHPHDSLCGCSIDAVHREMAMRMEALRTLEETLLQDTAQRLLPKETSTTTATIWLFQPVDAQKNAVVLLDVDMDARLLQEVNFEKSLIDDYSASIAMPEPPIGVVVRDAQGGVLPTVLLSSQRAERTRHQDATLPEVDAVNRVKLAVRIPALAPGFHPLSFERVEKPTPTPVSLNEDVVENRFYRIEYRDGAFDLLGKRTGLWHLRVHHLVDGGDAGDEYTYAWPVEDKAFEWRGEDARCVRESWPGVAERLVITGTFALPIALTEDRTQRSTTLVSCPLQVTLTLPQDDDRLFFETLFDNRARDHRLQVGFPSGALTDHSTAYHAFALVEHPTETVVPETYLEYPQRTHPNHGFLRVGNLHLAPRGLPEYEARNVGNETIAYLTLVRAVGWLSRTDLTTRQGNGGWTYATPDAQGQRVYTYDYALSYGSMDVQGLMATLTPPRAFPGFGEGAFPNPLAFLSQLPAGVHLSALKPAEKGNGLILRVFSLADAPVEVTLTLPVCIVAVDAVNLAEENPSPMPFTEQTLCFSIAPAAIATYLFHLGGDAQ